MKKFIFGFVTILLLIVTFTIRAEAKDYYVSSSIGNDSNPGTQDRPWKRIPRISKILSILNEI